MHKKKRTAKKRKLQKEQSPHFWGNPTFSGTGNYGVGGYKQLAHFGLNPATKQIQDQEQEELARNLDRQEKSVVGKGYRGTSITSQVPHWDGRNGSVETVAEEVVSEEVTEQVSQHNSVNRMRDLPGFPKHNTLVNPKSHVPANDSPANTDLVSGKKAEYLGPTLNGKSLVDDPENLVHEGLEEMLGHPKATKNPSRQGWNNQRINSLALRKNHINPENEPPEMWHPLFKDPDGEHNPKIVRDKVENMNSSGNNQNKPSRTPAWSMGSIGFPKQFVPDDYEQANADYDDIIKDPIGTRRLQTPIEEDTDPEKGSRSSVKSIYGSKIPDGMGGAKAFEKSRQDVLRNLVETIVQEVLQEYVEEQGTMAGRRGAKRMPGFGPAKEEAAKLSLEQLRQLLNSKPADQIKGNEATSVIDYVSSKNDLRQDFRQMSEKEIQALETVLDKNIDNEKIGPFYNKIEIARADKHLASQSQAQMQHAKTQPPTPQKKKYTVGSGPAQKVSLPKQPLSQQFTNAVRERYNQIVNAQGLNKQQKERLIQQLGQIQFEPESSESSKLKRIDDLVRVGVGTRVDFGGEPAQSVSRPIRNPGQAPQIPQQAGGFFGTAKRFLGLNEVLEFLLEEENGDEQSAQKIVKNISLSDLVVFRQSLYNAYDTVFLGKKPSQSHGPLEVMPIDDEPGKYQLIDGHHRLAEFLARQGHHKTNGMIEVVINNSDSAKSYYAVAPIEKRWKFIPSKKYGNLESLLDRKMIARDLLSYEKYKAGKKGQEI